MPNKKIKAKPKAKKANKNFLFVALAVIVLVALILVFGSGNQVQFSNIIGTTVISGVTQTGGSCTKDSECFLVGCKSNSNTECVNTDQMESYYNKCNGWSDVMVGPM